MPDDSVVFNQVCHGWRYGWVSSRHTSNQLHVFRVYILMNDVVIGASDSSPFTVSSLRNRNVSEVLGALSTTDPLRVILVAIHDRVHNDSMDLDFGDFADFSKNPDIFIDEAQLNSLMDVESEEKLLAIERVDALLDRMSLYIFENFPKWLNMGAMKDDLELFTFETEGLSVEDVACDISDLFGIKIVHVLPQVSQPEENADKMSKLALQTALSVLPPGVQICESFTLGGINDLSGHYRRPANLFPFANDVKAKMGWSLLEMNIWTRYMNPSVYIKILNGQEASICFRGRLGLQKTLMLRTNSANRPLDIRPLQFSAASTKVIYFWPSTTGWVMVRRTFALISISSNTPPKTHNANSLSGVYINV